MTRTLIKICCIASVAEAVQAQAAGADYLGLVGPMPSGPGVLSLAAAADITGARAWTARPVLLSAERDLEALLAAVDQVGAGTVQLVSHVSPDLHDDLARLRPGLERLQVLHIDPAWSLEEEGALPPQLTELLAGYGNRPDAFLLDSGRPERDELGGTGKTHDWRISAEIVRRAPRPVILAGGLRPDNVGEALARTGANGVDLCSSLRIDGRLDAALLGGFIEAVRMADAAG